MPVLLHSALLVSVLSALAADPAARLPVPAEAAQKEAVALIADLYKTDEAAAKTPELRIAFAKKLLSESRGASDDPAAKYVLLRMCRDLAAQQGDLELAFEAVDQMAAAFDVDSLALKAEMATTASKATKRVTPVGTLLGAMEVVIDQALAADRYDLARKTGAAAFAQARQTKDAALITRLTNRAKEIDELEKLFGKVKDAAAALQANPLDPVANQTVGWFVSAVKGDWKRGTPTPARGADAAIASLAKAELSDMPLPVELGDGWWKVAEGSAGLTKSRIQAHAVHWYRRALPTATGIQKTRVLKRMAERYGTLPAPKGANGLFQPTLNCAPREYQFPMGERFDVTKTWVIYCEAKIPNLDPGVHYLTHWGDDRPGQDPAFFYLEGKTIGGFMDNCNGGHQRVTGELPATVVGNWTRLEFVHRADESVLQIYVNGVLIADSPYNFKAGIDRAMPIRVGGRGGGIDRFAGELRNLVITNF